MGSTHQWVMSRRRAVHSMSGGRCFYCGVHVRLGDEPLPRDWLFLRGGASMVPEHETPLSRGGADNLSNLLPACERCNAAKGALTFDEFDLLKCIRRRDFGFHFWADAPKVARDWLVGFSVEFERALFVHNMPQAARAYGRGKTLSK